MKRALMAAAAGAGLCLALAGCYEDATVSLHEPGAYKGTPDPLLAKQGPELQKRLQERFNAVQTDR